MAGLDRSKGPPASAVLLALVLSMTAAEARGFGGGFGGTRVGAWGRPLGPVRPGGAFVGRPVHPGFAYRRPHFHRYWPGRYWGYYGYGLGGLGLGFGLGTAFDDDPYPYVYEDDVYVPAVEAAPVEVPVAEERAADRAAVAACARRFRTYDPATRTYVAKGYVRRRCP